MDIRGGYQKPAYTDVLWVQIVLLPYYLAKYGKVHSLCLIILLQKYIVISDICGFTFGGLGITQSRKKSTPMKIKCT